MLVTNGMHLVQCFVSTIAMLLMHGPRTLSKHACVAFLTVHGICLPYCCQLTLFVSCVNIILTAVQYVCANTYMPPDAPLTPGKVLAMTCPPPPPPNNTPCLISEMAACRPPMQLLTAAPADSRHLTAAYQCMIVALSPHCGPQRTYSHHLLAATHVTGHNGQLNQSYLSHSWASCSRHTAHHLRTRSAPYLYGHHYGPSTLGPDSE
jgi:hypothetical protein